METHPSIPSQNSTSSSPNPNPPTLTRSDPSNPYPTTFVQADTSSFKQVVQMLTGSSEPIKPTPTQTQTQPPTKASNNKSKLYERRNTNSFKPHIRLTNSHIRRSHDNNNNKLGLLLSPSTLDFPSLVLSPVTPLNYISDTSSSYPSPLSSSSSPNLNPSNILAEEKAIAEKGYFLHPVSPVSVSSQPRLLPLFPVTSPTVNNNNNTRNF